MEDFEKYIKHLNLLYVEDSDETREITSMVFGEFFDNIIVAEDGKDALEKYNKEKIDLIITDLNMPNMNGIELIREIRKENKEIPIIVISAHNETEYFLETINLGVNGYLLKPFDIDQLEKTLSQIAKNFKYKLEAEKNIHFLNTYQKAIDLSSIVSKTDKKGIITYVNDAFCDISGYKREELIGKNHNIVRHPDNPKEFFKEMWDTISSGKVWKGLVRNRSKDGKSYYVNSLIMPVTDINGEIIEYISIRHDVSEVMNPLKLLKYDINDYDEFILVYMKLENFEMMEEFYDNTILDMIQKKAKEFLQKKFKKYIGLEKFYNLGNGECAIIINKKPSSAIIESLKNLQEEIRNEQVDLGDIEYDISVLMSVVYEKNKMIESAKLGIKKLLKENKDFIVANNLADEIQAKAKENLNTIKMIKEALENKNIVSYFQPIIDNNSQKIIKYESLVRLINGDRVLSPFFFLDVAKKSNYYLKITKEVIVQSFEASRRYGIDVSINLSALDIEHRHTRNMILEVIMDNPEIAKKVTFELLEDEEVKDFHLIKDFITEIKEYGIQIAIDDFGSGYSNFERLLDYQPDILKIDGSLIKNIEKDRFSLSIVKSIVTFAKEQNLKTIAEFVENENIFNILKDLGVDYSQGYYFGKPDKIESYEGYG
ncbi:MAG: EAL domain-containing protein [Nautiliaceae bacterium]